VLAQGSVEYKWRFCIFDIAARLLELSQNSKNESLQTTCGMALSHLFTLVVSFNPAIARSDHSSNNTVSSNITSSGKLLRNNSTKEGSNNNDSSNNSSPFLNSNVPGAGARLVARVLEKGGLPVIIDTLRDGPPKLQQAYLNIINIVFSSGTDTTLGEENLFDIAVSNAQVRPEYRFISNICS